MRIYGILAFAGAFACAGTARAATDLTFFSVSDVHVGQSSASKDSCRSAMPGWLNGLEGQHYPAAVGGGVIAKPRGLLMPGDLIDQGSDSLWSLYVKDYDPKGAARTKIPAYEGLGNHEYYGKASVGPAALRARNLNRIGVVNRDATNLHYSWDWDGVHFVMLNLFSGQIKAGGLDPYGSYDFLQKDLAANVGNSGRPVLIMQHFPLPDTGWWSLSDAQKLAALLKQYNCIGLVHGHSHEKKIYKYLGLDVFDDGTVMNGDIFLFRITDGKMFVVNRTGTRWGSLAFQKDITMGTVGLRRSGTERGGTASDFSFSVDGLGKIWTGNLRVTRVEIADPSGRVARVLENPGASAAWDRADGSGRSVRPGLYLVRFETARGPVVRKIVVR
jgi:hypothetical protein